MSKGFNLTAQLNLVGPTNVKQIAAQIKKDLGNVNATVNFKLDPTATKNVTALTSALQKLNSTLSATNKSASSAASAIKMLGQSVNSVKLNNIPQQVNNISKSVSTLNNNATKAKSSFSSVTNEMEDFGKQAGLAVRRFTAFATVTSVIYGLTNSIGKGVQAFIEYDKELVRLQQVTGQSLKGLTQLQSRITDLSTSLGVSSKELTTVAVTLAQAGLSAKDTERSLKALALSSLAPSFDSMNETVEGSIALMRQFGIGAGELESALGSVNTVAAKFAVEASDIIAAIQRTGGVFATASKGVSTGTDALNEFIAVFTSVRATTRESAETIATGLRTIFTRVQRGDTINALKEFGVNLTDAQGKFVGAYKAVQLLSEGLNSIDPRDLKFSRIVEELGGFRQIGKVIPLIQQFSVAQEALAVAQQGQGSLARDAVKAQLSLANQISKVREQFFALFRELGQSQGFQTLVKGALSLSGALIKVADASKTLLPALSVMLAFKGAKALTQFTGGFNKGFRGGPDNKKGSGRSEPFADGGPVRKFARGGVVPGSGNRDTVPAMLMPGEFVIRKKAVETIGSNNLHNINKYGGGGSIRGGRAGKRQRFAKGGPAIASIDSIDDTKDGDTFVATVTPKAKKYQEEFRISNWDAWELPNEKNPKALSRTTAAKYKAIKSAKANQDPQLQALFENKGKKVPGDAIVEGDRTALSLAKGATQALRNALNKSDKNKLIKGVSEDKDFFKRRLIKGSAIDINQIYKTGRFEKKNLGGKIQKFAVGGKVERKIGVVDTDVLRDEANAAIVRPAMEKLGITDVSDYTTKLGELAGNARKSGSLSRFRAIAGAAGSGKSSLATGKGANDDATLRKTIRSQILTPEDIDKVNEVIVLTSTASQTKLDAYLKDVDRAYILSSNSREEQDRVRSNRESRDITGEGLYGRKPGTTRAADIDFGLEETILRDELGKRATVLGRKKDSFGLRRKRESELPEIVQAGGFYMGGFAPPTRGHRGALDTLLENMLAKNPNSSLEDILVSVAPDLPMIVDKEGIDHAARYGIFPSDIRTLFSQMNFGNAMISTQSQTGGGLPKFMEVTDAGDRRKFARLKGAMAITSGKDDKTLGKYQRAGIDVTDIPRIEDISATAVREALFNGDDKTLTSLMNPDIASILMGNRAQLRNRSTMVPMLIEEIQKFVDQDKVRSNAEVTEILSNAPGGPYGNVSADLKKNYPEIAEQVKQIRDKRDRVSKGAFGYRAFNIISALSAKYPETYGLDPSRKSAVFAQPSDITREAIAAQISEQMAGEFGGVPTAMPSGLEEAILKNVEKATQVKKSSGILPAQGSEILKRFGTDRLPTDAGFGPFSGKTVRDTAEGGKLKYWNSAFRPETKADKLAYYIATRDYLIDKFNESQGIQKATALEDTTNAVLSSKQLGLVGLNPLGYTGLLGPETWNLGVDPSGQERSIDASIVQRGLPTQYQNVIDYLSGQTEEIVGGAAKLLGISPKKLTKKQRETLGQGNIEGALLEQIFGSADATILDDALRTRPIDFPMGIGPKAAKIFGIDPDIPTEVKRTIDSGSRGKAVEEFQKYFRAQYGIPEPKNDKMVQKLSGGGLLKKYGEIFPNNNSTGPFKEMVFDFDDTLVTGGEIRKPDGSLDLSQKDNIPLVEQMLKKGKLTSLGQHLSEAIKQEPSLVDNISILSARNQNQAGILADTLSRLGLPIPVSKIRGSDGPQNKKITGYQKMIDDNLETITRLKGQGHEAIHYKFAKGGKVEEEYKQILASILPKEMLTSDGYLKMPSGEAEPIEFIPPRTLAEKSRSTMMSILLGKSEQVPPEEKTGAFYQGGLHYKTMRHRLEKNKKTIPDDEYRALKTFIDENLLFQGGEDIIKTAGGKHKGVLAHETFHDIQGYLYDNHPEIIDKLQVSAEKYKDDIIKWYNDPANAEWAGPKDYKPEHFFPIPGKSNSSYGPDTSLLAIESVKKKTKKNLSNLSNGILGSIGESQYDLGRLEVVPVLLSASAVGNKGANSILGNMFQDSGLNPEFYKTLPKKYKAGGVIRDIWHGTTTGKDDSVLESFKKYGAKSDVSHGFGQGHGFYVYSDPTSAMLRAMELEGGANFLTAADPNGRPMALKFTELLDGKNWDLDYEFQNADIVNFIHANYDRVKEAIAKSKGVDLGTNLKDFSLDKKYDEYLDTTDNTMMRKMGISFKDQGKDAEKLLANNNSGDARSGEVLSSLVKSLMHSDPDFYEEFENSFFNNLKPKQGLKYVGKDPLKPVLAQIFTRQKNINDTGWITEKFAKGGSPKDTVPALLTPGEFVVNKDAAQKIGYSNLHKLNKADKVQGYNKGGVVGTFQKLAGGGFADPNSFIRKFGQWFTEQPKNNQVKRFDRRPDIIGRASTQINKDVPKVLEDLIEGINKLGFSAAQSATVIKKLRNSSEVSYKEVEKALSGDLDKLKTAGAGFDTIIRAEEALYQIRRQGKRDVDLKRNLEGAFSQRGSATAQFMGGKMMMGDVNQGSAAAQEMIEKEAQYIISGATQKLRASGKDVDLSKLTDKAYKIAASKVSGVSQKSFSDFDISGKDIKEYINESKRDRKTLIELDKEYAAQKMAELKRSSQFASVGSKQQQRMIKELEKETRREISVRRSLINDLASRTGQKGVGAIDMMDFNNSPILKYIKSLSAPQVLGGASIATGLVAGQGKNIGRLLYGQQNNDAKIKSAETSAAIESSGIIISTGLATAAEILANVPGKAGVIAASIVAIGSTLYGLAEYFSDISGSQAEARKQQQSENRAVQLDAAMERLNRSAKEYETNVGNTDLRNNLSDALKEVNNISVSDAQFQLREAKLDFGRQSPIAGMTPSKATGLQYINETLGNMIASVMPTFTGLGASRETMGAQEMARINAEMASKNKETGAIAQQAIMSALSQGATREDIISGDKYTNERAGLLMSDVKGVAAFNAAMASASSAVGGRELTEGELDEVLKKVTKDYYEQGNVILDTIIKANDLAKAMEAADRAGRQLAVSFDRMIDSINQSINRIQYESQQRTKYAQSRIKGLTGESGPPEINIPELNILENPQAYTPQDFALAVGKAADLIGGKEGKNIESMINFSKSLPDVMTKAIADRLSTEASLTKEDASAQALSVGQGIINSSGLDNETKEKLNSQLEAYVKNASEKISDEGLANNRKVALEIFLDQIRTSSSALGEGLARKATDAAKAMLEFRQNGLNDFAKSLQQSSDYIRQSTELRRKADKIMYKANIDTREIFRDVGESYNEAKGQTLNEVAQMTGGITDPVAIAQAIRQESDRINDPNTGLVKQRDDALLNKDFNDVIQFTQDIQDSSDKIKNYNDALDKLANSTNMYERALQEAKNVAETQKDRQSFVEKLLTNTPEEADNLNQAFIRLQRNLSGGLNSPWNQRDARKAFNEALFKTGSMREAYRAGNTVLANQRKETLGLMQDPGFKAIIKGQIQNQRATAGQGLLSEADLDNMFRQQEGKMMQQMAIESGFANNPVVMQAIQTKMNPESEPMAQAAANQVLEAAGLQKAATEEQAKLREVQAMELNVFAMDNLTVAIIDLKNQLADSFSRNDTIEGRDSSGAKTIQLNLGTTDLGEQYQNQAAITASRGGLIYAAEGQMIDFKPKGTDTVPAMLSPGEFVINAKSTAQNLPLLEAINNGYANGGKVKYFKDGGLASLFRGFDKDQNSTLSENEFLDYFSDFDLNKDKAIDINEFLEYGNKVQSRAKLLRLLNKAGTFHNKRYDQLKNKADKRTFSEESEYKNYNEILSSQLKSDTLRAEEIRQQKNSFRRLNLNIKGKAKRTPEEEIEYQNLREEQRVLNPEIRRKQESIRRMNLNMKGKAKRTQGEEEEYQSLRQKWTKENPIEAAKAKKITERQARLNENNRYIYQRQDQYRRERLGLDPVQEKEPSTPQSTAVGAKASTQVAAAQSRTEDNRRKQLWLKGSKGRTTEEESEYTKLRSLYEERKGKSKTKKADSEADPNAAQEAAIEDANARVTGLMNRFASSMGPIQDANDYVNRWTLAATALGPTIMKQWMANNTEPFRLDKNGNISRHDYDKGENEYDYRNPSYKSRARAEAINGQLPKPTLASETITTSSSLTDPQVVSPSNPRYASQIKDYVNNVIAKSPSWPDLLADKTTSLGTAATASQITEARLNEMSLDKDGKPLNASSVTSSSNTTTQPVQTQQPLVPSVTQSTANKEAQATVVAQQATSSRAGTAEESARKVQFAIDEGKKIIDVYRQHSQEEGISDNEREKRLQQLRHAQVEFGSTGRASAGLNPIGLGRGVNKPDGERWARESYKNAEDYFEAKKARNLFKKYGADKPKLFGSELFDSTLPPEMVGSDRTKRAKERAVAVSDFMSGLLDYATGFKLDGSERHTSGMEIAADGKNVARLSARDRFEASRDKSQQTKAQAKLTKEDAVSLGVDPMLAGPLTDAEMLASLESKTKDTLWRDSGGVPPIIFSQGGTGALSVQTLDRIQKDQDLQEMIQKHGPIQRADKNGNVLFSDGTNYLRTSEPGDVTAIGVTAASMLTPVGVVTAGASLRKVPDIAGRVIKGESTPQDAIDLINITAGIASMANSARTAEQLSGRGQGILGGQKSQRQMVTEKTKAESAIDKDMKQALDESRYNMTEKLNDAEEAKLWQNISKEVRKGKDSVIAKASSAIEKGAMRGTEFGTGGGDAATLNARAAKALAPEMLDLKPGTTSYSSPQRLTPKGEAVVAKRIQQLAKATPTSINPALKDRGYFRPDAPGSVTGTTILRSPTDTFAALHEQSHAVSRILGILDDQNLLTKGIISKLPKKFRVLAEGAGPRISAMDEFTQVRMDIRGTKAQVPQDVAVNNALARVQEEAAVARSLGQKPLDNPSYVKELSKYNSLLNKDPTTPSPSAPDTKSSTTDLIKKGAVLAGGAQLISSGVKAVTSPQKEKTKTKKPARRASGGLIYAENGQLIDFSPKGTDTVPAMLTPGEFVVNAKSTKENLGLLHAINKNKGGEINYLSKGGKTKTNKKAKRKAPDKSRVYGKPYDIRNPPPEEWAAKENELAQTRWFIEGIKRNTIQQKKAMQDIFFPDGPSSTIYDGPGYLPLTPKSMPISDDEKAWMNKGVDYILQYKRENPVKYLATGGRTDDQQQAPDIRPITQADPANDPFKDMRLEPQQSPQISAYDAAAGQAMLNNVNDMMGISSNNDYANINDMEIARAQGDLANEMAANSANQLALQQVQQDIPHALHTVAELPPMQVLGGIGKSGYGAMQIAAGGAGMMVGDIGQGLGASDDGFFGGLSKSGQQTGDLGAANIAAGGAMAGQGLGLDYLSGGVYEKQRAEATAAANEIMDSQVAQVTDEFGTAAGTVQRLAPIVGEGAFNLAADPIPLAAKTAGKVTDLGIQGAETLSYARRDPFTHGTQTAEDIANFTTAAGKMHAEAQIASKGNSVLSSVRPAPVAPGAAAETAEWWRHGEGIAGSRTLSGGQPGVSPMVEAAIDTATGKPIEVLGPDVWRATESNGKFFWPGNSGPGSYALTGEKSADVGAAVSRYALPNAQQVGSKAAQVMTADMVPGALDNATATLGSAKDSASTVRQMVEKSPTLSADPNMVKQAAMGTLEPSTIINTETARLMGQGLDPKLASQAVMQDLGIQVSKNPTSKIFNRDMVPTIEVPLPGGSVARETMTSTVAIHDAGALASNRPSNIKSVYDLGMPTLRNKYTHLGEHTGHTIAKSTIEPFHKAELVQKVTSDPNKRHEASHHNTGGLIYANNGALAQAASGTDNVPAMLTPGEFVVNRESSQKHMPLLNAINSGHFNRGGIVNYLANGGVVAPKYYADGGQQLSNAIKQAPGVSNNSSNIGDIESALNKIVQSMSSSLEDKISQINQLNANMTGFIDNFGSQSQSLVDGLKSSTTNLGSYADKLSTVSLPDSIKLTGNVTSEHRFNGAEAANNVLSTLGPTMEQQTNNQLNNAFNNMNRGPGQLDSGIFGPDTTSIMGKSIK
jgi:TP901 family phage tail tape measure protein